MRIWAWGALALVVTGSLVTPASAHETPRRMPRLCTSELANARRISVDTSTIATTGAIRLDGRDVQVVGPDVQWRQQDPQDQTWTARFHGLEWLVDAASHGYPAVDLLLAREAALPDPGWAVDRDVQQSTGWTEGEVRLREGSVNCLYAQTKDPRLIPVIEGLVAANMDPHRYRGLPRNRVHNHGTLSNIALIESAEVFGRPEWAETAYQRIDADAASVFTSCGMTMEQSTSYHLLNVRVWTRALAQIHAASRSGAQVVADRIHLAALAAAQLARPDGILEPIGDGNQVRVDLAALGVDPTTEDSRLWCDSRGWAANRSSWFDDLVQYTLRFGPGRRMHGHFDQGSMTWFARGVPVFSDHGLYDKARGPRYAAAQSMSGHSTFEAVGVVPSEPMTAKRFTDGSVDQYHLRWDQQGVHSTRDMTFPLDETYLHVQDRGWSGRNVQWMQNWQLAEGWTVLPSQTPGDPVAVRDGIYLYGTCWSGLYMRPTAYASEAFPSWRTFVPVTTFRCGGLGSEVKIDTIWMVSPVKGTMMWDRPSGHFVIQPDPAAPIG